MDVFYEYEHTGIKWFQSLGRKENSQLPRIRFENLPKGELLLKNCWLQWSYQNEHLCSYVKKKRNAILVPGREGL
jgi:hypothetical protein